MWGERYSAKENIYGKDPNEFLANAIDKILKGKVLCVVEGESRNAVFLAEHGNDVSQQAPPPWDWKSLQIRYPNNFRNQVRSALLVS